MGSPHLQTGMSLQRGMVKLLLVAPERVRSERFLAFLERRPPSRFAVDAIRESAWRRPTVRE